MSIEVISTQYRQLQVSWPNPEPHVRDKLSSYRITLRNLEVLDDLTWNTCYQGTASNSLRKEDLVYAASANTNSITINDLIPDAFFKVAVDAVLKDGTERLLGMLHSSPRVTAAPPNSPPKDFRVRHLNDSAVLIQWNPPDNINCTGELRGYTAQISAQQVQIDKKDIPADTKETILSPLIPGTNYTVQMSAQTRAGPGPYSKSLHFKTTGSRPIELDEPSTFDDYPIDTQEKLFLCHPLKVNIRSVKSDFNSIQLHWDFEDFKIQSTKNNDVLYMQMRPKDCDKFPDSEILIKWDQTNDLSLKNTRAISTDNRNFTISQLESDTEYYVRISSQLNGQETYPYLTIVNTNPIDTMPFPLTYPKVNEVKSDSAIISWISGGQNPRIDRIRGYHIKLYLANPDNVFTESGVRIINVHDPQQTSSTLRNLKPLKVYKFSICRVPITKNFNSPIEEGQCSRTQTFETPGTPPSTPLHGLSIYPANQPPTHRDATLNADSISTPCNRYGEVSLPLRVTWPQSETASHRLFITGEPKADLKTWMDELITASYQSILLRNLQPDCTYYLRMTMVNAYGVGPLTTVYSFVTPNELGLGGGILSVNEDEVSALPYLTREQRARHLLPWNRTLDSVGNERSLEGHKEDGSDDLKWLIVGCISGLVLLMIIVVSLVHIIKYVIKSKNLQMAMSRDMKGMSSNNNIGSSNLIHTPNPMDYLSCTVQKPQSVNTSGFHSCSLLNNAESQSQVLNSTGRSSEISYQPNAARNFIDTEAVNQYRVTPVESESSFGYNNPTQNSTRRSNYKPFFNEACKPINLMHDCDANSRNSLSAGLNSLDIDTMGNQQQHQQGYPSPKNMQIMSNSLFYQNQYQQQQSQQLRRKNSEDQIGQTSSVSPTSSYNGLYREQFGSFGRCSNDEKRTQSPNQFGNMQSPATPGSRKLINHRAYPKPMIPSILSSKTYSCNMNENLTMSDTKMSSFKPYVIPSTPRVNATHLHSPADSKSSLGYDQTQLAHCTSSSGMGESPAPGELSTTPQLSSNSSAVDEPNAKKYPQPTKSQFNANHGLNQPGLQRGFSTEELTVEMANLEGLMKDLTEITNQEFKC